MRSPMTDESAPLALARIERALARIEAAAARARAPRAVNADNDSEARYQTLRARTQAALASLETVIAQAGGR